MNTAKAIIILSVLLWSCAGPKISPESAMDLCDKTFVCIGSRIEEAVALAIKDPSIQETKAKIAEFVCTTDGAKISLIVDIKMTMKMQANPDMACVDARINVNGNVHYFENTDTCSIGIVTSNFENLKFCNQPKSRV